MKKFLIPYLLIGLLISPFYWIFGEYSYRTYPYNLGMAIMWPFSLLKSYPEIDGSTPQTFSSSLATILNFGTAAEDRFRVTRAFGVITFYFVAKNDQSVSKIDLNKIYSDPTLVIDLQDRFIKNNDILIQEMASELDGITPGDMVDLEEEYMEKIDDLFESRKAKADDEKVLKEIAKELTSPVTNTTDQNENLWSKNFSQATTEYYYKDDSASLAIFCPEGASVSATFESNGQVFESTDELKNFNMEIDGEVFTNPFNTECRVCADIFVEFWKSFAQSKEAYVVIENKKIPIMTRDTKAIFFDDTGKLESCNTGW